MVEKFRTILENIERQNGAVTLFALLKMDEYLDKWTLVFCAPWSTELNRSTTFEMIRNEILRLLDVQEISEIARISIFTRSEHLIEELLKYQSGIELRDQKINGNIVHFAHIIKSDPLI